jgi:hypothetical protein
MKSNTLPIASFLAAVAAFVMLPMSAAAAAIAFTVTGVLAVLVADYGRNVEPLRLPAQAIPFISNRGTPAGLREAA